MAFLSTKWHLGLLNKKSVTEDFGYACMKLFLFLLSVDYRTDR